MKKVLVMFLMLAIFVSAQAQSSSNFLWMVASKSAMISYAISQIQRASVSVYSGGSVSDFGCNTTAWAYNLTEDKLNVFKQLKEQGLSFSVARPDEDYVGLYSYAYGVNGDVLFYGGNYGKLTQNETGSWEVPSNLMYIQMYLGWEIPIYVPAAIQAKLLLRDENGYVVDTRYLEIKNGYMLFPTEYIGRNGDLAVTFDSNGSYITVVSSVRENELEQAEQKYFSGPNIAINGVWDFGGDIDYIDYLSIVPESYKGRGESPLLRMSVTYGKQVFLRIQTTEGEKPTGLWVKNPATGEESYYPYGNTDLITIDLPYAGIWEVIFEWESFDNQDYQPAYWGKG